MHFLVQTTNIRSPADQTHVLRFTDRYRRKKQKEALHINKDSSPLLVVTLCFASVIALLVTET
jgi:hypothetical protein